MNKNVIILGAGGHAKVVADIVRKSGDTVLGFLDDDENRIGTEFFGSKILGSISDYSKYTDQAQFIVAVGNNSARKNVAEKIDCGWYTAIHPSCVVGEGVKIGEGSLLCANTVINPDTRICSHTIINTGAVVEHDCSVGDFCHISPSATVCGGCNIGSLTWIGAGAVVKNCVSICDTVTVGAGAVVIQNIDECGTFVGVPARKIFKN